MSDQEPPVVDESVPYVQELEVHHDAEDVKRIRFSDDTTTVEVGITDDVLPEFLDAVEEVGVRIHEDMADLRERFEEARGDGREQTRD